MPAGASPYAPGNATGSREALRGWITPRGFISHSQGLLRPLSSNFQQTFISLSQKSFSLCHEGWD
jgi:hypothetical protein